ncbi:hypothetical protein J6590_056393 [Homalodisca vitripennis]|nr:hypothetical protein J6590_056393 [Homalodisca vitripennis]
MRCCVEHTRRYQYGNLTPILDVGHVSKWVEGEGGEVWTTGEIKDVAGGLALAHVGSATSKYYVLPFNADFSPYSSGPLRSVGSPRETLRRMSIISHMFDYVMLNGYAICQRFVSLGAEENQLSVVLKTIVFGTVQPPVHVHLAPDMAPPPERAFVATGTPIHFEQVLVEHKVIREGFD